MARPLPRFGLAMGDRLEPSELLPDHAALKDVDTWPFEVVFWRRSREVGVLHRNPLFCPETGCSIANLCIDQMHTMFQGIVQVFVIHVIWRFIIDDVWGIGQTTEDERSAIACLRLRSDLMRWYKERARARPTENLTEVQE
eukprot:9085439-Alexandrium_andersonii.AAC.1